MDDISRMQELEAQKNVVDERNYLLLIQLSLSGGQHVSEVVGDVFQHKEQLVELLWVFDWGVKCIEQFGRVQIVLHLSELDQQVHFSSHSSKM